MAWVETPHTYPAYDAIYRFVIKIKVNFVEEILLQGVDQGIIHRWLLKVSVAGSDAKLISGANRIRLLGYVVKISQLQCWSARWRQCLLSLIN